MGTRQNFTYKFCFKWPIIHITSAPWDYPTMFNNAMVIKNNYTLNVHWNYRTCWQILLHRTEHKTTQPPTLLTLVRHSKLGNTDSYRTAQHHNWTPTHSSVAYSSQMQRKLRRGRIHDEVCREEKSNRQTGENFFTHCPPKQAAYSMKWM